MKTISFPYILDAGDGGYYFLVADTEAEAQEIIKLASDELGYDFNEPSLVSDIDNKPAVYNALSLKSFEPLGYDTKDALFKAYDEDPELQDSHAYSLDGYEGAVIGVADAGTRFVYDFNKMVDIMVTRDQMTYEDALEWYSYNIERSFPYYQPCPIILNVLSDV